MRINLAEIPEEGKAFQYDQKHQEMKEILSDIISDHKFMVNFYIRPINSKDFELTGAISASTNDLCSRCGIDFNIPLTVKLHEILIPHQTSPRQGKYAKVNHVSDSNDQGGPSSFEYEANMTLNVGEYIHEAIALVLPFNPAPPVKDNGDCTICDLNVNTHSFNYDEEMPVEKPESPFSVLKNIKLN